jgi:hypothetical protein
MRRIAASLASCALLLVAIQIGEQLESDAATAAPVADATNFPACIPLKLVSSKYVTPDRSMLPSSAPNAALVQSYAWNGTLLTVKIPPAGWWPVDAPSSELAFYDVPPRPTDPGALAAWRDEWIHYTGVGRIAPCIQPGVQNVNSTSTNWGGIEAYGNTYTQAYGQPGVPHSLFACPHASGHSIWVGLGGDTGINGFSPGGLLQNGITDDGSTPNQWYWFFEAISWRHNPTVDTGEVEPGEQSAVGDRINITTIYDPTLNSVHFGWHDLTSGQSLGLDYQDISATDANGNVYVLPTSSYYDGGTAETIDERPAYAWSNPTRYLDLRKWDSGPVNWTSATVSYPGTTGAAIRSVPHTGLIMNDGNLLLQPSGGADPTTFSDAWMNCE